MSETVVSQDDYNKLSQEFNRLALAHERLLMGQTDVLRRIEVLNTELDHQRRGRAMADIGIEKMIGKIDGIGERTEKLESNQTWFIRAVTGLVISALGILLFKVSGAKPI